MTLAHFRDIASPSRGMTKVSHIRGLTGRRPQINWRRRLRVAMVIDKSKHVGASRRTPPGRDAEVMLPGPGRAQVQPGLSFSGEPRAFESRGSQPLLSAHRAVSYTHLTLPTNREV